MILGAIIDLELETHSLSSAPEQVGERLALLVPMRSMLLLVGAANFAAIC
jgi:hypothetical protein